MTDDSGPSLFGDEPAAKPGQYLVLARKYRPRTFEDMIGQEAMVRTIANSFQLGRVPHAYMLTGVRGVGKTTTARLLARALNYESDTVKGPTIALDQPGVHDQQIMESRHPDVFEMDAASRTGINDIREILDSVRYAPVMARNKIYIIDEVHMLSSQAFNGLLKTLEEPPPHVKFIFATTEIRKVPVTVLSRCQRFDLKRIGADRLAAHLKMICEKEGIAIEADGLALIARAGEGSVRDALSLLDQAMVQKTSGAIRAADVRDMLGLADRQRTLELFAALTRGDARAALSETRAQYDSGADPALILRDLLEIGHEAARVQALGDAAAIVGGAEWDQAIRALAGSVSPAQLARYWQMLLKALEDATKAPEPIAALEMALVRVCAAAGLPPPEEAARLLREGSPRTAGAPAGPVAPGQTDAGEGAGGPIINGFDGVLALIAENRAVDLEIDVERYVRLSHYEPGKIVFQPAPGAPRDLAMRLARALKDWTGQTWEVRADGQSEVESLAERRAREREAMLAEVSKHPLVAEALKAFPGAEIVDVRAPPKAEAAQIIDMPATKSPAGRKKQG